MLPKIFYRGRFQKLCAIYGARIELWPDHEQPSAHAYIKRCPQKAEADLAGAVRLDGLIKSFAPDMVSEESQWHALGQLVGPQTAHKIAVDTLGEESPAPIVFGADRITKPEPVAPSEASLEIREERARMIAKNKKLRGKGDLKFQ